MSNVASGQKCLPYISLPCKGCDCNSSKIHSHEHLAIYVKLLVAHAPGMPGSFLFPPPRVSDPDLRSRALHTPLYYMTPWCYHDITVSNPRAEKTTAFWQRSLQVFTGIFIEMETRTFVIICKGKNLVQWVQTLCFYNLIYSAFHRIVCFNQPCPIGT